VDPGGPWSRRTKNQSTPRRSSLVPRYPPGRLIT
jgi:hypothetical protein